MESAALNKIEAEIHPGRVDVSGSLASTPPTPFSGVVDVSFNNGQIGLELTDASLAVIPVPDAVRGELQPLIDEGLDINRMLNESGAAQIQAFDMQDGLVTIVGVQKDGQTVSDTTRDTFLQAFQSSGSRPVPVPPGADVVPVGTAGTFEPGDELYLAIGDSLAANVGVSNPQEGYVSRFHSYLENETGRDFGLMNLGISGESSISIMRGQFQQALNEIEGRRDDGDPNTKVSVLTIDLGANDLITHLGSADCQNEPRGTACQARINAALDGFVGNFDDIVKTLDDALEDDAELYIMTMYNPFDFGLGLPFEDFSNEIVERLNDIIVETANSAGAKVADPFDDMGGNAAAWTNMLQGDIHPNADGFQSLAFSLTQAQ
jgi:lysophospholipase L1-like esterase